MSEANIAARRVAASHAAYLVISAPRPNGSSGLHEAIEAATRIELTDELCERVRNNSTMRHLWVHEMRMILTEFCALAGFEVIE